MSTYLNSGRSRQNTIDGDDFWAVSQIERSANKFNLFDDDISVDNASNFASKILSCRDEDDEVSESLASLIDCETATTPGDHPLAHAKNLSLKSNQANLISRTGTPAKPSNLPGSNQHCSSSPSTPATESNSNSLQQIGSSSYGHGRSKSDTTSAILPDSHANTRRGSQHTSSQIFPKPGFSSADSNLSIDDVIEKSVPKTASSSSLHKLEAEVISLKHSLRTADREKWLKPPISETLKRIRDGEAHSGINMYRTREDKVEILNKATESHDGNIIITVVLFLRQTLKDSIFHDILKSHPIAANHYISHMRALKNYSELIYFLKGMDMHEEAAMTMYKQAISCKDLANKFSSLKKCLQEYKSSYPGMSTELWLIESQLALLEWQNTVESMDKSDQRNTILQKIPPTKPLVDTSVIYSLYYSALYHYNDKEAEFASPNILRNKHQLTEKQFLWTTLTARAYLKAWPSIEDMLTTKGNIFSGKKLRAVIGLDKVAELLYQFGAEEADIKKYLLAMNDNEKCLQLSQKLKCYETFIETCVAMKDRRELEIFAQKFSANAELHQKAIDALNTSTIKWK
ncbi:spermatogenesis-defective protein 39 homolog isoform X1 [Octopus vulgaris]|uniref:Spermatogenesis-defective protein 39 homolog isoform X1 n=2 Tax=Octopus TaxID=6643 RepID=A0AA36BBW2_OCTVU|nr:spermatogenesis-defective protein 39 homolog [Octopus sinensis]CAI9730812.1 spermatogenesis-defective protein 39 homolog isoform X1 [Octopus vulgaris]